MQRKESARAGRMGGMGSGMGGGMGSSQSYSSYTPPATTNAPSTYEAEKTKSFQKCVSPFAISNAQLTV